MSDRSRRGSLLVGDTHQSELPCLWNVKRQSDGDWAHFGQTFTG